MSIINSPLRYPGGKAILSSLFAEILTNNSLRDGIYIEPFCGGAGAALSLLYTEYVSSIVLNDIDPCVYAFWKTILYEKEELIRKIQETDITIEEWRRQRDIYRNNNRHSQLNVAFAFYFLNRCNRSGIVVNGGPIGGLKQNGKWKINARFNKKELIRRIEKISMYKERIEIHNMDAVEFIRMIVNNNEKMDDVLIYLDPPYYSKGSKLYLNYYCHEDHANLAEFIQRQKRIRWIMTYDDVPMIKKLYRKSHTTTLCLGYSIYRRRKGSEILIYPKKLIMPSEYNAEKKDKKI